MQQMFCYAELRQPCTFFSGCPGSFCYVKIKRRPKNIELKEEEKIFEYHGIVDECDDNYDDDDDGGDDSQDSNEYDDDKRDNVLKVNLAMENMVLMTMRMTNMVMTMMTMMTMMAMMALMRMMT